MPLYLDPDELRDQAPGPHLDLIGTMAFRAAGAAQRLGVFEALLDGPLPVTELAARTGTDAGALPVLLDALVSFGYLDRLPDRRYAASPMAAVLDRRSPWSYAPALAFWQDLLGELWDGLEETVRTGRPQADFYGWLESRPRTLREFQAMLDGMATGLAPLVAAAAPDPGERLLDVGGGHARYSIAFCQAHPRLTATIVDLPEALRGGRARIERAGLGGRVTAVPGDVARADLGAGHDTALLFNLCHGFDGPGNRALLARVAAALRPGGTVLILEPFADLPEGTPPVAEAFTRAFSLNLAVTQGGRIYSFDEVAGWLAEAGFGRIERHAIDGPSELLVARLPGAERTPETDAERTPESGAERTPETGADAARTRGEDG
ncbi:MULTISPECIES: methyltransferase [Streptosporangium]|uniref:SAM-dependent methyltransferase n=1 Tax=Streptosporangium brasiliense TaxID=47480 RepID=A0ABT9QWA9_9ACTN|nr:methyltransferase [Streptosporangium brasiliense]MDP9861266.1 SAM-dependent methyltransferase [Streptosporangium brasiliense]